MVHKNISMMALSAALAFGVMTVSAEASLVATDKVNSPVNASSDIRVLAMNDVVADPSVAPGSGTVLPPEAQKRVRKLVRKAPDRYKQYLPADGNIPNTVEGLQEQFDKLPDDLKVEARGHIERELRNVPSEHQKYLPKTLPVEPMDPMGKQLLPVY